jgi:hypothetical protein
VADAGRDGEVRHVGSIGGDLAALDKALRKLISRGHWGILDNVIGGPCACKRAARSQCLERRQPRDANLS